MKKLISAIVLTILCIGVMGQQKKKFPFTYKGNFSELEAYGDFKVVLVPSTRNEVQVAVELEVPEQKPFEPDTAIKDSAHIAILKRDYDKTKFVPKNNAVKVEFINDTLKIVQNLPDAKMPRVWIQVLYKDKGLKEIRAFEKAYVYCGYLLQADSLILSTRTKAKFEARVSADYVHLESGEEGFMNVNGRSNTLMLQGTSNGEIFVNEFATKQITVILSTNATASIPVPNFLKARVTTGAVLTYYGNLVEGDLKELLGGKIVKGG